MEGRRPTRPEPRPITADEAVVLFNRVGPFEANPHVAIAVSGGPDSMTLALLARDWASACGGRITALTVDHRIRPESAREARQAGAWLSALDIAHEILAPLAAPASGGNLQALARMLRYRLMTEWCKRRGVLHLVLAHHQDDQAETVLLRLGRGSGVDGLAAMAPVVETATVRLLRPLLAVPRARLLATASARGQNWIEDPTNRDPLHARVRMRAHMPALTREGLTAERIAATAARMGRARSALEDAVARLLAACTRIDPCGFAVVEPALLCRAPEEIGLRALGRILACIGGHPYPPRLDGIERLYIAVRASASLPDGRARTLAGCRISMAPSALGRRHLLVCREVAAMAPPADGAAGKWDGRFSAEPSEVPPGCRIGGLGREGWREVRARMPGLRRTRLPGAVRPTLPAFLDDGGIAAVPHLGYRRDDVPDDAVPELRFSPLRPLAGASASAVVLPAG